MIDEELYLQLERDLEASAIGDDFSESEDGIYENLQSPQRIDESNFDHDLEILQNNEILSKIDLSMDQTFSYAEKNQEYQLHHSLSISCPDVLMDETSELAIHESVTDLLNDLLDSVEYLATVFVYPSIPLREIVVEEFVLNGLEGLSPLSPDTENEVIIEELVDTASFAETVGSQLQKESNRQKVHFQQIENDDELNLKGAFDETQMWFREKQSQISDRKLRREIESKRLHVARCAIKLQTYWRYFSCKSRFVKLRREKKKMSHMEKSTMETEDRRSYELRKEFIAMLDELRQMRFEDDSSRNNLIALFSISRTHALGDNNLEQFSSSIGLDTLSFSTNNETSEDIKNIDTTIGYSKDSSSITLCSNQHRVYDVIVEEQNLSYATHPDPDIAIDVEYDFSFVSDGDYDSPADNEDQQGEILKEVTVDIQQSFVVEENHFTLGLISNYLLNPIHSLGKISNQIAGYFPNSKLVRSAKFTNKNKRRSISNSTTNKQYSCPNYYSTEQFTLTNDPIVLNISVEGLEEFKDLLQKDFVIHHFLANVNKIDSIHDLQEHNTLESISISDNKIENIDELCNLKNLLLLNVDINRISKLKCIPKQLRAFTGNYNRIDELLLTSTQMLTRLELFSNRLSTVSLKSLPNLTYLDLGNNHFEDIDGHIFSNCHLLHTLILSQNKLTRAPVLSLPNLSTLKLNGNLLTNLSTWRVYKDKLCSYLPKLRKLFIQDNLIDSFHRGIFSYMLSLQEVDASFNKISHTDNLLGLWELPLCTVVKLNDNPFITNNIEIRKQFLFSLRYSCSPLEMSFLVRPEIFSERFRYKPFNVQAFRNTSYSQPFSSSHFPSCHSKACDLYNLRDDVAVAAMKKKKYSYEKLATLFCDQSVHTNSIGFVRLLSTLSNTNYQQHDFICLKQKLENSGSLSLVQRQKVVVSFDPTKYHKAATIIQSYFRGTKTRRRMKELMSSVKYVDAELDDLLADDISFDYGEDESEVACLVYGDHIKKRSQIRDIPSRPSSATSDTSAVTISSGVLPDDNASDEGYVAGENLARMVSPRNSLAEDWGIKDPKLLATFMKRNKRIRKYLDANDKTKDRGADYRFQKFLKQNVNTAKKSEARKPPPAWLKPG